MITTYFDTVRIVVRNNALKTTQDSKHISLQENDKQPFNVMIAWFENFAKDLILNYQEEPDACEQVEFSFWVDDRSVTLIYNIGLGEFIDGVCVAEPSIEVKGQGMSINKMRNMIVEANRCMGVLHSRCPWFGYVSDDGEPKNVGGQHVKKTYKLI